MAIVIKRILFASFLLIPLCSIAEIASPSTSDTTRIFGTADSDLPTPGPAGALGVKDSSAMQMLSAFLAHNSFSKWPGIQGTGTLSDQFSSNSATLTILGGNQSRLDVADSQGMRSLRIHGFYGTVQNADGQRHSLPPATASQGVFALPVLLDALSQPSSSVLDRGMVVIEGQSMHRITLETPAGVDASPVTDDNVSLVDLYFDSGMHQLQKSVAWIRLNSTDRAQYLQVLSYGDYRDVNGLMLPHSLAETLNGQTQWTLRLNDIRINPSVASSYFHF